MTFSDYSSTIYALSLEEMEEIRNTLLLEVKNNDEAQEFYNDLLEKSLKYTEIRSTWGLYSVQKKANEDDLRTAAHNRVITAFNILARFLKSQGKDAIWREKLGDTEKDPIYRKRIGDMAAYLVFMEALSQR